jgi:hypothetical protein
LAPAHRLIRGVYEARVRAKVSLMPAETSFRCPNCDTAYKVVRVEAPATHDEPLLCLSCGGPLHNRDGKFALKYFRTDGSRSKRLNDRKPKLS